MRGCRRYQKLYYVSYLIIVGGDDLQDNDIKYTI